MLYTKAALAFASALRVRMKTVPPPSHHIDDAREVKNWGSAQPVAPPHWVYCLLAVDHTVGNICTSVFLEPLGGTWMPLKDLVLVPVLWQRGARGTVNVHHPCIVGHHHINGGIDKACRQVAFGDGEVPHRDRASRFIEGGIGIRRNLEGRDREGFHNSGLLFLGELNDVHVGLHLKLGYGRNGDAGGKGDDVKQTILELAAKVGPAAIATVELHTKFFHHAWEVGV